MKDGMMLFLGQDFSVHEFVQCGKREGGEAEQQGCKSEHLFLKAKNSQITYLKVTTQYFSISNSIL
jgi:hypothetical protein